MPALRPIDQLDKLTRRHPTSAPAFREGPSVLTTWLRQAIEAFANQFPDGSFFYYALNVRGLVAVILVSLICGAVGSLVVGNRMAFFSDALAHCAFAGVTLGLLLGLVGNASDEGVFYYWGLPAIMVGFGIGVGVAIAFVREKTALASDTVIGVFFAGAIGFGAMLYKALSRRSFANPESFLLGNLVSVEESDLILLFALGVLTALVLLWMYNRLVFVSFNPSLARSRNISQRLCSYLFIVLLAMIVNLSLKAVGSLLINALLIVPAATAGNLCRNMRQLFWTTIGLSLFAGVVGQWLSFEVRIPLDRGERLLFGPSGTIVVITVVLFFASMAAGAVLRRQQAG
jgi:zinc transport system permease protein